MSQWTLKCVDNLVSLPCDLPRSTQTPKHAENKAATLEVKKAASKKHPVCVERDEAEKGFKDVQNILLHIHLWWLIIIIVILF